MREEAVRCPKCGDAMLPGLTTFCFGARSASGPALVENIPALVCGQCGHATYSLMVAEEIDRVLDERPEPNQMVAVPVYGLVEGRYRAPANLVPERG